MRKDKRVKNRIRVKKRRPFYKNRIFWALFFSIIILGALFYFLILYKTFQTKIVKISGNVRVPTENILEVVSSKLEKKILFYNTKSILLINTKEIEKDVLDKNPIIAEIIIARKLPDTLVLDIKERMEVAIFCLPKGDCSKVDKEGIAFLRSEEGAENNTRNNALIFSQNDQEVILGKSVIEKQDLESILEIKKRLKDELGTEVESFAPLQDKLVVKTLDGFEVYFDIKGDIKDQIFNLDKVLKEQISPQMRAEIQYIDLRFGSRIYFK